MSDLRDKILAFDDRTHEVVNVPEWGVDVNVYTMTARDKTRIEKSFMADGGVADDVYAKIVQMCVCDDNGVRVFTDKDVESLQDKSAPAISRIAKVAMRLSKLTESDEALAEKN